MSVKFHKYPESNLVRHEKWNCNWFNTICRLLKLSQFPGFRFTLPPAFESPEKAQPEYC